MIPKDKSGMVFGKWTVVSRHHSSYWTCRCECGAMKEVLGSDLTSGKSKSCGCVTYRKHDINIGDRFSRWTVIEIKKGEGCMCRCDCGTVRMVNASSLVYGLSRGCPCGRISHGMSRTSTYKIWENMKLRCSSKSQRSYNNYGGRGISVCDKWKTFNGFIEDMGTRPSKKHTIERIDNDGNYEPGNCKWATYVEQATNRRNTIKILVDGELKAIAELSESCGIPYKNLYDRLRAGWSIDSAISTPVRKKRCKK